MAHIETASPLGAGLANRILDAHDRWEGDCLALDLRLCDAGLPFGANGYKLAVQRGVYRLVEGVTLALTYVGQNVSPRSPDWSLAHRAILDAVDQQFLASSRLIATPSADPVLEVATRGVKNQIMRHWEGVYRRRRVLGFARAIRRIRSLWGPPIRSERCLGIFR